MDLNYGHNIIMWNKGLTKYTDERVAKNALSISDKKKDQVKNKEFIAPWYYMDEKSRLSRNKHISESKLLHSKDLSIKMKRLWKNPEYAKNMSEKAKERWKDSEFAKKVFGTRGLSKEENKLFAVLQENWPNYWHYVGNGKLRIGGKYPDFINKEHKKIIELWGDYYHKGQNPQDRIDLFKQHDYSCIVIWASELKDKINIINKVSKYVSE